MPDLSLSVFVTGASTVVGGLLASYLGRAHQRALEQARADAERLASTYDKELQVRNAEAVAGVDRVLAAPSLANLERRAEAPVGQAPLVAPAGTQTPAESLINSYHEQALGQARAQFWFSTFAATIGLAWILLFGADTSSTESSTLGRILPGIVIDAVAFLFFRQASETRQRATELYDRLRRDKLAGDSLALVSSIEDLRTRSAAKAQIALHMAGVQSNTLDVSQLSEVQRAGSLRVDGSV